MDHLQRKSTTKRRISEILDISFAVLGSFVFLNQRRNLFGY